MNRLQLSTFIDAAPEDCYRLALTIPVQERALARVHARAVSADDRPLQPGETVTWKARWLGLPWTMTTQIVSANPPRTFVDHQVSGPFGCWRHEHRFTPCGRGTVMDDDVSWSAPLGIAGQLVLGLGFGHFVAALLRQHNRLLAAAIHGDLLEGQRQ